MKSGILHLNVKPDKVNDFKKTWDQFVSELHKETKGLHTAFLHINPETGKAFSIGFYDTAENAQALPSSEVYRKFISSVRDFVTSEPSRELYDVSGDLSVIAGAKKAA